MPFLKVNGCQIYYTVKGQGTPILFIHPPVLSHINFTYQMKTLSKYFKVISFDMRGHGRSQFSKQELTYPLIVEDMRHLLDELQIEKTYICGYSAGGSIALQFLLSEPDRAIGGIVISGMSEVEDWVLKNRLKLGVALSKAVSALAFSICWTNSNIQSLFWKMFKEAQQGKAKNIKQYYRYSLSYNCTGQLREITHPVLLIYGEDDQAFHPYASILNKKLPHNELSFIKNGKHQIPTKAATDVNALIQQFINRHTRIEETVVKPYHLMELEHPPEDFYQK